MSVIPQYELKRVINESSSFINIANLNQIRRQVSGSQMHSLMYYDITLITEGEGTFRIDDKKYSVYSKDVIFSTPGEIRSWETDNIKNGYVLMFEEEFLLSLFNKQELVRELPFFNPNRLSAKMSLNDIFFKRIISLITEIRDEPIRENTSPDKLINEILYLLQHEYILAEQSITFPNKVSSWHVNNFIRLVNAEYTTHQNINYYADKLGLTPNYLNEIVKKTTGLNAKQFILHKIALKAKGLLARTRLSVKEISDQLNFSSSSYFIRFFHKQTGETPLQYRHGIKAIGMKR